MARGLDWEKATRRESVRSDSPSGGRRLPAKPATERQLRYIAALCRQLGVPVPKGITTSRNASTYIETLKKRRDRRR
jgi:hypothetical protein